MGTKKEITCECCKRPFRKPNLPLYNLSLYGLGVVCMDCANKIEKIYNEKGGFAIGRNTRKYINSVGINDSFTPSVVYKKDVYEPFNVNIDKGEWKHTISFSTLNDLKKLRDTLNKFINECEV